MLDIYSAADPTTAFSVEGDFGSPFSVSFNGTIGETIERKLFVRNDSSLYYYQNITLQPIDGGDNIVDGSGSTIGYSWKLYAGDQQPTSSQWGSVSNGNQISFSNIGSVGNPDVTTYLPFWIKIVVPRGAPIKSYGNVALRIGYTQQSV